MIIDTGRQGETRMRNMMRQTRKGSEDEEQDHIDEEHDVITD
jgi:hypothetical protein